VGTADPAVLAEKFDVVVIGVDYLQSGRQASINDPEPYDHGYLQALDALRALHFVFDGLKRRGISFDSNRIFTTGGSGGGNVSLMANKLAPRTFAAVIDMCGMKKLSDDVAFNLPGGSSLNARWVRDRRHPFYLSPDAQQLRFTSHPGHLAEMKRLGCTAKIFTVHGTEDTTCADADEFAANMKASGLDFTYVRVTRDMLDGVVFTSAGHPLGNRTLIVARVAGRYLDPGSPDAVHRRGSTDFERRDAIRYATAGGCWIIDYSRGYPVGRFESSGPQARDVSTRP
jgi:acetyl esterase/lipase